MTAIKVKRSKFGFQQQPVLIFCLFFLSKTWIWATLWHLTSSVKSRTTKIEILAQWKMDGKYVNLNCFYSIFVKKRNSHGHFGTHNITPRNCCFGVITLCSLPKSFFFLLNCLNLPVC